MTLNNTMITSHNIHKAKKFYLKFFNNTIQKAINYGKHNTEACTYITRYLFQQDNLNNLKVSHFMCDTFVLLTMLSLVKTD